jgi:hypothetical protein
MANHYQDRIEEYCKAHGVDIPVGFYRHAGSRYAAIDMDSNPPKLIARRWFKHEDVVYYLRNLAPGKRMRILDFKDRVELLYDGGSRLQRGHPF